MWYILSLQYCMDIKPVIRTNIDGTFILREPNLKNRRNLWENYAGIIPDFSLFCNILDQITDDSDTVVFHAGTKKEDDKIVTAGGRVLGVTGFGKGIEDAIKKTYKSVEKIKFDRCFFRRDIGAKAKYSTIDPPRASSHR